MTNRKIVLASIMVIVAAGLMVLSPIMVGGTQAQMYDNQYGYDNNYNKYYPEPKSSHIEVQKISCLNDNTNINGIDITEIPQEPTPLAATNEGGQTDAANTQNGNGLADRINFDRNTVNICINVNVNDQIRSPNEELTATLNVAKAVSCFASQDPEASQGCERLLAEIPNDVNFIVSGNNPNPSQFPGSPISPEAVTLDPGNYEVSATEGPSFDTTIDTIENDLGVVITQQQSGFTQSDCTQDPNDNFRATGTIAEGESQTCFFFNQFGVTDPD